MVTFIGSLRGQWAYIYGNSRTAAIHGTNVQGGGWLLYSSHVATLQPPCDSHKTNVWLLYSSHVVPIQGGGVFLCGYGTAPIWLPYSSHLDPLQGGGGIPVWLPHSSCVAPIQGDGSIPLWLPYSSRVAPVQVSVWRGRATKVKFFTP